MYSKSCIVHISLLELTNWSHNIPLWASRFIIIYHDRQSYLRDLFVDTHSSVILLLSKYAYCELSCVIIASSCQGIPRIDEHSALWRDLWNRICNDSVGSGISGGGRCVLRHISILLEGDNAAVLVQLLSMNVAPKSCSRRPSDFYTLLGTIVRL